MRIMKITTASAALALALAACGSGDADHAGSNVTPPEDTAAAAEEEPEPEPEEESEPEPEPEEEPEPAPEEAEDDGGWQVPTTPYGEAADIEASDGASGVWSVVAFEPECGVEIEPSEFSFMEDTDAQGQWCQVEIEASNDADQPLDFWMDHEVAVADWDGRSFTPDSDAVIEVNDGLYEDTQVGQTFTVTAMFDVPEGVELAGVAMTRSWVFESQDPIVWAE